MMKDTVRSARLVIGNNLPVPDGVKIQPLNAHVDGRGSLTELFRDDWSLGPRALQWNMVRSKANVLRGVHAHRNHVDYLTMAVGELVLCLHDLRPASPTHRLSAMFRLQADDPHLVVVPVGVAHGFYFPEPACHVYAVSHYFDTEDELGCHWAEPALGLTWPCHDPELSEKDRTAGSYADLIRSIAR